MKGYDFGIRSRIMILGDTEFMKVWDSAGYIANGYDIYPQYGVAFNVPFIAMIFENYGEGRKLFQNHFLKWAEGSGGNGDAVHLSFIEFEDGSYSIVIAPETDLLVERVLPNFDKDEVEPIAMISSKIKEFPKKSDFFQTFKKMAETNPVLLMPGTLEGVLGTDLIIRKNKIQFFLEHDIPQDTLASVALHVHHKIAASNKEKIIPAEDYSLVVKRREKLLKKYFPVTLERLVFSATYASRVASLSREGYKEWQIKQAVCNLILSYTTLGTMHYLHSGKTKSPQESSMELNVYDLLANYRENPSENLVSQMVLDESSIKKQIEFDSIELLRTLGTDIPDKLQSSEIQEKMAAKLLL